MKTLTIKDLKKLCEEQIKIGNGNKKILLSDDDEGNNFHECFFAFTNTDFLIENNYPLRIKESEVKDYIILG